MFDVLVHDFLSCVFGLRQGLAFGATGKGEVFLVGMKGEGLGTLGWGGPWSHKGN